MVDSFYFPKCHSFTGNCIVILHLWYNFYFTWIQTKVLSFTTLKVPVPNSFPMDTKCPNHVFQIIIPPLSLFSIYLPPTPVFCTAPFTIYMLYFILLMQILNPFRKCVHILFLAFYFVQSLLMWYVYYVYMWLWKSVRYNTWSTHLLIYILESVYINIQVNTISLVLLFKSIQVHFLSTNYY